MGLDIYSGFATFGVMLATGLALVPVFYMEKSERKEDSETIDRIGKRMSHIPTEYRGEAVVMLEEVGQMNDLSRLEDLVIK